MRDEQTVERVTMVKRKTSHAKSCLEVDRQGFEARTLDDLGQPSLGGAIERELPQRLLDGDFPGRDGADVDVVCAVFDCLSSLLREAIP
jgi:hypothetical protein